MSKSTSVACASLLLLCITCRAQVVSVCTVLTDLKRYEGKIVTVRGFQSGGEGVFLMGSECQNHLVSESYAWPDAIWLTSSRNSDRLHDVPFQTDQTTIAKIDRLFEKAGLREGDKLFVSVTGFLETDEHLEQRVFKRSGEWHGVGFGHDNVAPAQLIMKSMSDPEIVRCVSIPLGKSP